MRCFGQVPGCCLVLVLPGMGGMPRASMPGSAGPTPGGQEHKFIFSPQVGSVFTLFAFSPQVGSVSCPSIEVGLILIV